MKFPIILFFAGATCLMTTTLSLAYCTPTQNRTLLSYSDNDPNSEKDKIRKQILAWEEAWNSGDPDALAAFYMEDARLILPGEVERNGRAGILKGYAENFAFQLPEGIERGIRSEILTIRLLTEDVAVVDYRYTATGIRVAPLMKLTGRTTVAMVRYQGKWLRAEQRNWAPMTVECYRLCQDAAHDRSQENRAIVTRAFEVVGAGDYGKMHHYIAENYVRHCPATPDVKVRSLAAFKDYLRQDRLAVPDQKMEVKHLVADGDLVGFWATYSGTQTGQMGPFPPSGKYAEIDFSGIHRLENGKIVESWVVWDNVAALTQFGHFSPPEGAK